MATVLKFKRRPRPLRKQYSPQAPYEVEREDEDDGSITYHVADMRPETYRTILSKNDDGGSDPWAKHDAENVARAMNLLVQLGKETLPKSRGRDHD
jgi:hypothetical protein